jgi:putative addiction module killer protein
MNTIKTTGAFDDWFGNLKDRRAAARIQMRIDRAEDGNFGDSKPVGEGVSELRIVAATNRPRSMTSKPH